MELDQFGAEKDRRASPDDRRHERWHVGKEIPIAMIVALLIQTGAGVSWLSNLSFKIESAIQQLQEFKSDRYTKDDARRDRELVLQIIESQRQRDAEHDRRIQALEDARGSGGLSLKPGYGR